MANPNLKRNFYMSGIKTRLNYCLKEKGLTALQASVMVGFNHNTLYEWARGNHMPDSIIHIKKACEFFNIKPDWLLYGYLKR